MHFLLLGLLLFALYAVFAPVDSASRTISVDRPALLEYLQYRAKRFDPAAAENALNRMTAEQRDEIVSDYIEQEILYRQAMRYGLDRDDDVIKQRLVQKSRFILEAGNRSKPTLPELKEYYRANISDYMELPKITFTHVFFDTALRGAAAKTMADNAVSSLNARGEGFSDSRSVGDRFPYLVNYVERPLDYVVEHFGDEFVRNLSDDAPIGRWLGPVRSQYGWHAVLVTERFAPRTIPFEQVRGDVAAALSEQQTWNQRKQALASLRRDYDIRVDLD